MISKWVSVWCLVITDGNRQNTREITGALGAWHYILKCHCTGSWVYLRYHTCQRQLFHSHSLEMQIYSSSPREDNHTTRTWHGRVKNKKHSKISQIFCFSHTHLSFFILGIGFIVKLLPFGFLIFSLLLQLLHALHLFLGLFLLIFPLLCQQLFPKRKHTKEKRKKTELFRHMQTQPLEVH